MKNLSKLGAAVALTFVLALSVFAGQTDTPPCPLPELGQTDTPPCAAAPGDMGTPAVTSNASGELVVSTEASNAMSLTEIAASALLNFLPLF
jgi:hypothetical protein